VKVPARFRVGIGRVSATDAAEVAEFQLRTFGPDSRQVDHDRLAWLFDQNPCRREGGRDLWICRRDGAIVGQQAEIPFDLRVGPDERRAAWAVDLMVDDAWRVRGIGPALIATQVEATPIVCGLNLSEKGFAAYTRGGWADLGVVPAYLRPLDVARAARLVPLGPRVRRITALAQPMLRAFDSVALASLRLTGAHLEPIERFDERVDDVWSASIVDYPVLARRDWAALAWRIDERPDRDHLWRFYLVRRGRTIGYVVLRPSGSESAPTAVVVDYLAPARWVARLLVAAGAEARRRGAIALSIKTRNEAADRSLRAAGFLRRVRGSDDPVRFMVHCTDDGARDLVTDPGSWFVTSADSDLDYAIAPTPAGADADAQPSGPSRPAARPAAARPRWWRAARKTDARPDATEPRPASLGGPGLTCEGR
jgi:hypothetical protein